MMTKGILLKLATATVVGLSSLTAQSEGDVDAIEKARQAKEAADKAAADAAAATEAAIEAAAAKAAKAAREEAKRKKEEEEARKVAEAAAAEEAELDAAAQAAAREAKRKMAAELGLEMEDEIVDTTAATVDSDTAAAVEAKSGPLSGFNFGVAASIGVLSGETFTNTPTGGTVVLTTPFGFKLGPLDYTVSIGIGGYSGSFENEDFTEKFDPIFVGLGGNLTLANFLFSEGHMGLVGEGYGFRGFGGVTLERLMKNSLNLPFNVLVGSEIFFSSDMAGAGNSSGWASLGLRLDYSF